MKNNSPWSSVDEYVDFAVKHQVFGAEAVKLKLEIEKPKIPLPRIKIVRSKLK